MSAPADPPADPRAALASALLAELAAGKTTHQIAHERDLETAQVQALLFEHASDRDRYLILLDAVLVAKQLTDPDTHADSDRAWVVLATASHAVRDSMRPRAWNADGVEAEQRYPGPREP